MGERVKKWLNFEDNLSLSEMIDSNKVYYKVMGKKRDMIFISNKYTYTVLVMKMLNLYIAELNDPCKKCENEIMK